MDTSDRPRWQNRVGWVAAVVMAVIWLVVGIWKLTNLTGFQLMLTQMLVPVWLSFPGALALGITETFAGVLLLRPAWRKLGGYLSAALLVVFMAYVGYHYETLKGEDCSCFPWLERTVGPGFFWGDAAMVAVALVAAWFSPRISAVRSAGVALLAVALFGATMLVLNPFAPPLDAEVPASISVDSGNYPLDRGRIFIYFFNPACPHCLDAGQTMAKLDWQGDFVGVPTQDYDFAPGFIEDTGLKNVKLSPDLVPLKKAFPFEDVPYAVALEDGKVRERLMFFEEPELSEKLRGAGMVK